MGRKVDWETKEVMERAARKLFWKHGFSATSYADIAAAVGKEKSNVQKHFPKKSLFVEHFFEDLLDSVDEFYAARDLRDPDYFVNLYRIGVIHFAFLTETPEMRRFTMDILSDRALTEVLIHADMKWASTYLTVFSLEESTDFQDKVALVMGGVYELVYQMLADGRTVDVLALHQQAMRMFAFVLNLDAAVYGDLFSADLIPDGLVEEAVRYLKKQLF